MGLLLTACSTAPTNEKPAGMRVATSKDVTDCELKGDVHGVSMLYGVFAEGAMSKARQQAFKQAQDIEANTVVWEPFHTEVGATSVHGNAYSCK